MKSMRMKTGWDVNKDFCHREEKYTFHTISNRFTHIFAELSTKIVDNYSKLLIRVDFLLNCVD